VETDMNDKKIRRLILKDAKEFSLLKRFPFPPWRKIEQIVPDLIQTKSMIDSGNFIWDSQTRLYWWMPKRFPSHWHGFCFTAKPPAFYEEKFHARKQGKVIKDGLAKPTARRKKRKPLML
jgi:hypothetical protein